MRGKIYPIAIITFQTTNIKELCCRSSLKKITVIPCGLKEREKKSKFMKFVLAVWGGICSFQRMIYNVNITLCLDSEQVLFDYNT